MPPDKDFLKRFNEFKPPTEEERAKSDFLNRFNRFKFSPIPPEQQTDFEALVKRPSPASPITKRDVGEFATELIPGIISSLAFHPGIKLGTGILGALTRAAASIPLSIGGAQAQKTIREFDPETLGDPRAVTDVALEDMFGTALGLGIIGVGKGATAAPKLFKTILGDPKKIKTKGAEVIREVGEEVADLPKSPRQLGVIAEDSRLAGLKILNKSKARVNELFGNLKELTKKHRIRFTKIEEGVEGQVLGPKGLPLKSRKEIPIEIEAPIQLGFVQNQLNNLKNQLSKIDDNALTPEILAQFNKVRSELDSLTTPINTKEAGKIFVAPYESVKELITLISGRTFGKSLGKAEGLEVVVSKELNNAIKRSFNLIDPNLNTLRDKANLANSQFRDIFPQRVKNTLRGVRQIGGKAVSGNMETLIKQSLSSKKGTDQLLEVLGGDKTLAKEFFLSETITNSITKDGILDLDGFALSLFKSRQNKGAASLLSDKEFKTITKFFEQAEKSFPFSTGNAALRFEGSRFQMFGTFAGLRSLFRGDIISAITSVGAGLGTRIAIEIGPDAFAKAILLDPKKAAMAKGLLTGSIKNKGVQQTLKIILGTKGLIGSIRVFGRGDEEGRIVAENVLLSSPEQQSVSDIRAFLDRP